MYRIFAFDILTFWLIAYYLTLASITLRALKQQFGFCSLTRGSPFSPFSFPFPVSPLVCHNVSEFCLFHAFYIIK